MSVYDVTNLFLFSWSESLFDQLSFPTRRSSDLAAWATQSELSLSLEMLNTSAVNAASIAITLRGLAMSGLGDRPCRLARAPGPRLPCAPGYRARRVFEERNPPPNTVRYFCCIQGSPTCKRSSYPCGEILIV